MNNKLSQFIFPFTLCLSIVTGQALSDQSAIKLTPTLEAGKLKAMQICANCHGLDGWAGKGGNSATSPRIGAQQKNYLVSRLKDYQSGKIQHAQMSLVAQMLSEQDIENVAEWYSRIKIDSPWFSPDQASMLETDQAANNKMNPELQAGKLKASQICSNCHGLYGQAVSAGSSVIVPNLTAQQKEHLIAKLKDYRSGRIKHPQMSLVAKMLTDQDIQNVAEWYSGIEVTVFDPEVELSDQAE